MDFACIKTGGKQYKVREGDVLKVEKIRGSSEKKKKIELDDIFQGKKVSVTILSNGRRPKIRVLKFKPKKRYKKILGHRQQFSEIKIEKIRNV